MNKKDKISQAQDSLDKFEGWAATQTEQDLIAIARGSKLHRGEIIKGAGIAKSTLNDNSLVKAALRELEAGLREKGVLAPLSQAAEENTSANETIYNQSDNELKRLKAEVSRLTTKSINQAVEIERLRSKLSTMTELDEVLYGGGILSR